MSILAAVALVPGMLSAAGPAHADNPIVQTIYTADPAPLVYNNRLYVYTGHDEDGASYFTMKDWHVYATDDMANWTDLGSPLSVSTFSWAKSDAWAGQVIYRNGKFYYYVPVTNRSTGRMAIGVAVANSPTGPFQDALGRPLVENGSIDPTVFIDDDGQAYLYWGNPNLYYLKLNQDMISTSTGAQSVTLTTSGFGTRSGDTKRPTLFEEGPWVYKRSGTYYLVFAAKCCSEFLAYSTGPGPLGPWTYRGTIMPTQGSSFTNHPGVIDYKGGSYLFYHNGALPGGGGYQRSVAVEKFTYGSDGSIPSMNMTTSGPPQISSLDPYVRQEAETIAWESGIETEQTGGTGAIGYIDNGDYVKVRGVAFGTGATKLTASVASATSGGTIEARLDSASGTVVATCQVPGTGGWQTWTQVSCPVSGATGTHDLYLRFTGGSGSLFNVDWWQFSGSGTTTTSTSTTTSTTSPTTTTTSPTTSTTSPTTSTTTTTSKTTKTKTSKTKTTKKRSCKNTRKCSRTTKKNAALVAAPLTATQCRAEWVGVQSWGGGYTAQIRVRGGIAAPSSWTVQGLPTGQVLQSWGASVTTDTAGGQASGHFDTGDGVTFGFVGVGTISQLPPLTC